MKHTRGFTLIELAIVLVIVTILIGGLAVPLSAQIQARRIAETRADMNAIREAIIGYAMRKSAGEPYLPCPDDGTASMEGDEGNRDAGRCLNTRGRLPWRTLGVEGADAWGNRYTYAVTRDFTNDRSMLPVNPGFDTNAPGDLEVHENANCTGSGAAHLAAVVIVSHGPNGRGAQNKSGGTPLAPAQLPANERANLAVSTAPCLDQDFVIPNPGNADFDDLVVWLNPNTLTSRLCREGCPLHQQP
jgi:prepilin-type N-terminal cleavage/methylation domain-containing protein